MKKLLNKKGFTLMEMMIVIAIIVILIAIAVPNFNSSLNSANEATDSANYRAAQSAGILMAQEALTDATKADEYYYDLSSGSLQPIPDSGTVAEDHFGKSDDHDEEYIKVVVSSNGTYTIAWE